MEVLKLKLFKFLNKIEVKFKIKECNAGEGAGLSKILCGVLFKLHVLMKMYLNIQLIYGFKHFNLLSILLL